MRYVRRRRTGVRFFMCGEYGDLKGRPHYHAVLFNCWFDDMKYWRMSSSGFKLFRSVELERLWPHGNSEIGMVSLQSSAYVARYALKKVHGDAAAAHYAIVDADGVIVGSRVPEFARMSLKPGIGSRRLISCR